MSGGTVAACARRTVAVAGPPMTDAFPGPSIDTTKWTVTGGCSIVSGRLRIVPTTSYPNVESQQIFDMTAGYRVCVQIPTLPIAGNGTIQTRLILSNANYTNTATIDVEGNPRIVYSNATGSTGGTAATYNATSHAWLGMRVASGNLLYEASPDGVTWTTLRSVTAPSWVTSGLLKAILQCVQTGANETSPGYAEYDNFNLGS